MKRCEVAAMVWGAVMAMEMSNPLHLVYPFSRHLFLSFSSSYTMLSWRIVIQVL